MSCNSPVVTIAIGTNPSSGTLTGNTTASLLNGIATFSGLTIDKIGNGYTLVVASGGLPTTTSSAINITLGAIAQLIFTTSPSTSNTFNVAFATQPVVALADAGGNTVTSSSNSVTLSINNNPNSGFLSGTLTVFASSGVVTYSGLSIDSAGTGYTLLATFRGITGTSATFNVTGTTFISSWDTTKAGSANNTIILPLVSSGTYDFIVDWGDSTTSHITSFNQAQVTHVYGATGVQLVQFTGVCTGFVFNNAGDRLKLMNISQWGTFKLGNNSAYFFGCSNLTLTAADNLCLSGTNNLSSTFQSCTSLTTNTAMNNWNLLGVLNVTSMFNGATLFTQSLNGWNTSTIIVMTSHISFGLGCIRQKVIK